MQSPAKYTYTLPPESDDENHHHHPHHEVSDMAASVSAVETLLNYRFKNKKLLEDALSHPSYTGSASYQRLEFIGDAALGLAISNYVYLAYPNLDPGKLSLLRAANISTEKFARVAVRHQLYKYVRHNAVALDQKVREFVLAVEHEDESEVHGGLVKAPKVLADIVESVAAAVYVDCNFDLQAMWMIVRDILEPIIMLSVLEQRPQPVTTLFELCQKYGKQVDIKYWTKGEMNVASVYVDGHFLVSAASEQKENAKLHAAKAALQKLSYEPSDMMKIDTFSKVNGKSEIEEAKQKLNELCSKKKWPKPTYKIEKEVGHDHDKRYTCSVAIETAECVLFVTGNEKSRVKNAENSAASSMICGLSESNYL